MGTDNIALEELVTSQDILDRYVQDIEIIMKNERRLPDSEMIGWSFTGRKVWSLRLRPFDEGDRAERALAILEAIQLYCFSPNAMFVSYFFADHMENDTLVACAIVADSDKLCGYFGRVVQDEEGKYIGMTKEGEEDRTSLQAFDNEMFGALSGVMQFSGTPIEDVDPLINVLRTRGHEVIIHGRE